jgi:hypothetical protein
MKQIAQEFLTRCFSPAETIALLLRREIPSTTTQRVVRMEHASEPRYQAWLEHENRAGSNIYVAANPLHPGSRKRTKENISSIRHLYIDIDTDGESRLAALLASNLVPIPTAIVSTSPGKYQVLWQVEGFDFAQQEEALKVLTLTFGGDPACTDCNRVLRIPGFLNRKYDPAYRVTAEYPDDSIWTPKDFKLDADATPGVNLEDPIPSSKRRAKQSNSESDWAWVSEQLARGRDATNLTVELATRRPDKPNPVYYAQRTVDVASARLWLIAGICIDDVIAMLERRRHSEISAALCSTRAREIAATAQRMITPRRTA